MARSSQRNMRWAMVLGLAAALPFTAPPSAAQPVADATLVAALPCSQLKGLVIPDSTITITKAEAVPNAAPNTVVIRPPSPETVSVALPSHCRADGEIDARIGSDGKPSFNRSPKRSLRCVEIPTWQASQMQAKGGVPTTC